MLKIPVKEAVPVHRQITVFGFKLTPLFRHEFLNLIEHHIATRQRLLATHLNLHGLAMMYESPAMVRLLNRQDAIVTIDGMSLIALSRLAGYKLTGKHRITSLDYIDELLKRSVACNWNIYYVGGFPDVIKKGVDVLKSKYPGLSICGHHGYFLAGGEFSGSSEDELLCDISARSIDLLIVGMGMPRQEEWVENIRDQVNAPVILTIGAMLEYFSGSLKMPPRWLGPVGLEWLFRLATAPRRLAFRYLIEPFFVFRRLLGGPPVAETASSKFLER